MMDKNYHEYLIKNNGYYLFLVNHNNYLIAGKLISAIDIDYKKSITWDKILEKPKGDIYKLGVV